MLNAPVGQDFELAPAGLHLGLCYRVIDTGTHHQERYKKWVRKILIMFELSNLKMKDGKPFIISGFWTLSLNKKATLRKFLEQWRNKAFSDEEAEKFDLMKLLNVPAQINLIHREKNGDIKANIEALLPAVNMSCPQPINKVFGFSLQDYSDEKFGMLSEKLQKRVMESREWKSGSIKEKAAPGVTQNEPDREDDIPYQPPF